MQASIRARGGLGDNRLIVFISESSRKAHLYEIAWKNNKIICDTIYTYGGNKADANSGLKALPDLTDSTGVTNILNDAYQISSTTTYSTIVGCHGTGWLPRGSTPQRVVSRAFGGSVRDTQIDIDVYAAAIRNSNIKQMQFILFDDCYLANIETAYALRKATHYLIASTSEIMSEGMPYSTALTYMLDIPNYNNICQAFYNYYSTSQYPYGTLSAIDCSYAEDMASLFKTINAQYCLDADKLSDVEDLDGYRVPVFFEMQSYIDNLCQDNTLKQQFSTILSKLVPSTVCTPQIYSVYIGGTFTVDHSSGITISDPSINISAVSSKLQTAWWKATH